MSFLLLGTYLLDASVKENIALKNVSVICLITLKLGADLFAVTMFVKLGAASLSPTLGLLHVYEAAHKLSEGLYKYRTLPSPRTVKESVRKGLGKYHTYGIFLPHH